ncbi:MAG: hypothetical protein BWY39_01656 [Spirochaetes bacterium ADurb.Bin269]|nr:MAG: hypothetical protein BWY39_01656 [Spirochaetes bacterium ADurb.Bin269]
MAGWSSASGSSVGDSSVGGGRLSSAGSGGAGSGLFSAGSPRIGSYWYTICTTGAVRCSGSASIFLTAKGSFGGGGGESTGGGKGSSCCERDCLGTGILSAPMSESLLGKKAIWSKFSVSSTGWLIGLSMVSSVCEPSVRMSGSGDGSNAGSSCNESAPVFPAEPRTSSSSAKQPGESIFSGSTSTGLSKSVSVSSVSSSKAASPMSSSTVSINSSNGISPSLYRASSSARVSPSVSSSTGINSPVSPKSGVTSSGNSSASSSCFGLSISRFFPIAAGLLFPYRLTACSYRSSEPARLLRSSGEALLPCILTISSAILTASAFFPVC